MIKNRKYIAMGLLLFIAIQILFHCVFLNIFIPSDSMAPTLNDGDMGICFRLSKSYKRGDIVVFLSYDNRLFIKRIIGIEGDQIAIKKGGVFLNQKKLEEKYIKEEMKVSKTLYFDVPKGCYFVMGDNRNHSNDSRFWDEPYVKKDDMRGKLLFRYRRAK